MTLMGVSERLDPKYSAYSSADILKDDINAPRRELSAIVDEQLLLNGYSRNTLQCFLQ